MKNAKNNKNTNNMHSRKGVIDAQFNWIFVMIAGFVIFLFIIGIVYSQKHNADKQTGIAVINQITTLLKGKQQTSDVYSEITLPRTNINFKCDVDTNYFTFKIENSERTQLPVEIIFAPQDINTNKMLVWSQIFSTGFPVGAFTYITTTDSIILMFNNTDTGAYAKELSDDIPSNITHRYIANPAGYSTSYSDFKRRRIVCFEGYCPGATSTTPDTDYLKITPAPGVGLYDYGNITFHKKGNSGIDDNKSMIPYISKAGLYGAIFSDTSDYYVCQMSRAMEQFEIKRSLVEHRLLLIQDKLGEGDCKTTVNSTLDYQIIPMSDDASLNWDNATDLDNKINELDVRNTYLGLSSCQINI